MARVFENEVAIDHKKENFNFIYAQILFSEVNNSE